MLRHDYEGLMSYGTTKLVEGQGEGGGGELTVNLAEERGADSLFYFIFTFSEIG